MRSNQIAKAASLLLLGALAGAGACDGDDPSGLDDVAGVYVLRTVNGENLPFTWLDSGGGVQITAGSLALTAEGQFVLSITGTELEGGEANEEQQTETGTYELEGSRIRLQGEFGWEALGNVSGGRITLTFDDLVDDGGPLLSMVLEK